MFDFLKKKLNKTIKDASESTEEEMTQHDKEFAKDLDNLEEAFSSIEDKYSKSTDEEEKSEDTTDDVKDSGVEDDDKKEDISQEDNADVKEDASVDTDTEEEVESIEDDEEKEEESASEDEDKEDEEDDQEDSDKTSQEEDQEDSDKEDSESSDDVGKEKPEEEKKEENKGRFSFFRRNKKEEKPEKSEPEEKEKDSSDEEIVEEDNTEQEESTAPEEKESEEDEKEEKKGRFSFFRRNKTEDKKEESTSESEEKEEVEKEAEEKTEESVEEPVKEPEKEKEESGGMFSFITKKTIKEEDIEDILDELFMSLLEGDVAYEVADKIVESVKEDLIGKKIQRRGDMELFTTNALKSAITEIIDNGSYDLLGNIEESKKRGEPYKIMFVGINGTGKTTTIAKMATYLEKHGYSSVFGASDTFRAGAIEQLEHHAKNLNLKIIKHERNSDPAAVAYDAVEHARATGKDVVLIDTSGRMQTNANLMDEMKKIKRVSQPDFVMYVGDALMGNDATEQASKFNEVIDIDGIILTKADADAKGGAALSIGHVIHKPILFIGTGQSYDDLMEFKPEWMINLIFEE